MVKVDVKVKCDKHLRIDGVFIMKKNYNVSINHYVTCQKRTSPFLKSFIPWAK
jgi:hypothetical protein